jgi:1-acyl-sn-glycerol-3-phosphate acyltransferase
VTDSAARERLVGAIVDFLAVSDLLPLDEVRAELEREIDAAGPAALLELQARLAADSGWSYSPRDLLAQRIHHLLAARFLGPESHASGVERLAELAGKRVVMLSNHLSYADANVIEVLLQQSGAGAVADRLTALAGPKVFTDRQRRFSSLCFGTIKVPQSSGVSTEEARLTVREVARAARAAIDAARGRLTAGDVLLLFGEGTRSRTAALQPMLAGAARYLELPDTWVLPVSLTGSEAMYPIDGGRLRPATVTLRIGHPIAAHTVLTAADRDRQRAMDALGRAVAELLPPGYRGVYAATRPA